ncbi:MAG: nucleotidyltransferase family protein [Alphaproteobacteria bacterium]
MMSSPWHLQTLRAVRDLNLPDWAIGAGFVRNAVWDRLHDYGKPTPLSDIDVLYFDPADLNPARDGEFEVALAAALAGRPWSVRNQARMHLRNADRPYHSTEDAIRHWLETPTCVAVRLDRAGRIDIISPFGLSDLMAMRGAPTVAGLEKFDQYMDRMQAKNWPAIWPDVRVEGLEPGMAVLA